MGRITNKIIPNNGKPYPKDSKNTFFSMQEKLLLFWSEDAWQTSENDEWMPVSCCCQTIHWKVNFPCPSLVYWENRMDTKGPFLKHKSIKVLLYVAFSVDMHNIFSCCFNNCILFHYRCGIRIMFCSLAIKKIPRLSNLFKKGQKKFQ